MQASDSRADKAEAEAATMRSDKEVLASVGRLQDMQALQYAAQQLREQERAQGRPQPGAVARAPSTPIAVGDDVTLLDRNRNSLSAKVTAVNSSTGVASITILHGGGVEEACDKDVSLLTRLQPPGSPGQAQTAAPTPATTTDLGPDKRRKVYVARDADQVAMECAEQRRQGLFRRAGGQRVQGGG